MILTAFFAVVGCNNTFEMDLPLAVSSRLIDLTKDAGSTHIIIYADGDWTAKFTETTEWASLDRLNGNGNSEVVLSYSANYGLSRRLAIALSKNELKDTIVVNQAGLLSEPSIAWPCDSIALNKTAGKVAFDLTTNLFYSLENVNSVIQYEEGNSSEWISNLAFDGRKIAFDFTENSSESRRRAKIEVKVDIPGDSSKEDKTEVFELIVSQDNVDAKLELADVELLAGMKNNVSVETVENSMWAYSAATSGV